MDTQDIVETWRQEARAEARAEDVLTVLRVRGIAVSEAARNRVLAEKDLQRLERWHEKPSSPHRLERYSTTELRVVHRKQAGPRLTRNAADAGRREYLFSGKHDWHRARDARRC